MDDKLEKLSQNWQINAISHRGPRAENQDNYLVIHADGQYEQLKNEEIKKGTIENWPQGHIRIAVADGMGGHNNGRQAAEAVIDALLQLEYQSEPEALQKALFTLHDELFEQFHQGAKTPGSTLVMVDISPTGKALIANIGDSRAYLHHNAQWKLLTKDHTALEFAYRDGEIDTELYAKNRIINTNHIAQALVFGSSGIIKNSEGIKNTQHLQALRIEIEENDIFIQQLEQGDVLMLASDGLWSGVEQYIPDKNNVGMEGYVKQQIEIALENSKDNITVCCVKM